MSGMLSGVRYRTVLSPPFSRSRVNELTESCATQHRSKEPTRPSTPMHTRDTHTVRRLKVRRRTGRLRRTAIAPRTDL